MWENVPPPRRLLSRKSRVKFSQYLKSLHLHHLKTLEEKPQIIKYTVNPGTLHEPLTCGSQEPSQTAPVCPGILQNTVGLMKIKLASWHANKPTTKQILSFAFLLSTFHLISSSYTHILVSPSHSSKKWHQHSTSRSGHKAHSPWARQHMPVIPALGDPRKAGLEFENGLGYSKTVS